MTTQTNCCLISVLVNKIRGCYETDLYRTLQHSAQAIMVRSTAGPDPPLK